MNDLAKLGLTALGFALLYLVSHSQLALLALLGTACFSYGLGRWLLCRTQHGIDHVIARGAVPAALIGVVLMNVVGWVGTLTGSSSSVAAGGVGSALVAMPFYLLAAAAFVSDAAARKIRAPRFLDFMLFLALPFKLLAGPLETPKLLGQIGAWKLRLRWARIRVAWPWLALGAFMKYVIANRLDPARHLDQIGPVPSLVTAAIFELKFYFDFAGYSFLAYGTALALGLRISQNFDQPFLAPNVVLFWRRWHMSLGRFLSRYILEPNLALWDGRTRKLLFASSIFMVSAMWHGGTLNYLMWGLFHGLVYYGYGRWMKRRTAPHWLGLPAMLAFFVFGRMLAVEADSDRLLARIAGFFDPSAYSRGLTDAAGMPFLAGNEAAALLLAALFLACEVWDRRLYPGRQGYHLMRRPVFALVLTLLFVAFGRDAGTLLYARI